MKRLQKELQRLVASVEGAGTDGAVPGLRGVALASEEDIGRWILRLEAPPSSLYHGALWQVEVTFPAQYPNAAPKPKFLTPIFHPAIDATTGDVCEGLFSDWTPAAVVADVVGKLSQILLEPGEGTAVINGEAEALRTGNNDEFKARVAKCVATAKSKQ
jgi:ubiquitin-protein ligase